MIKKTKTAKKKTAAKTAKTTKAVKAAKPVKVAKTVKAAKAPNKKNNALSTTTAAILGQTVKRPQRQNSIGQIKVKQEWSKYYKILMDLRERLLLQMDGLAKESAEQMAAYSLHMADSGTDNFDRDFALSLLSSDQDAIYEIEEALKRIERDTYGVCELTGKHIPKARLNAIPWTRFTVEAQAQLERDGALRQRRLGSLGSIDSAGVIEIEDDDDSDDKPAAAATKEKED